MLLADSWSLGVLILVPVTLVCLLIGFAFVIWGAITDDYDSGLGFFGGLLIIVVTVAAAGFGFYPYHTQYHKWHTSTNTVKSISSRFLGSDSGTTQRFVVGFGNGELRSCDDTRCALVKVGDKLTLSCKRAWQFSGTDGWDCNYVKDEHA